MGERDSATRMQRSPAAFVQNAEHALHDPHLQQALRQIAAGFGGNRRRAAAALPEFEALCDAAAAIKDHTLDHLDLYLTEFERQVIASGGHVHWCADASAARQAVLDICREANAKTVTKGKSMVAEEIDLNPFLEAHDITPVETDLGEYIIQLADEPPSHIIGPAIHKTKDQVSDLFHTHHRAYGKTERLEDGGALVAEARELLRQKYIDADVGITGANFLIAETGSTVIVTNEGNGDLTQSLPPVHIVVASIEKIVPTLEDAATLLRVLARSATGQEMSVYTTFSTGPRRAEDMDGPAAFHVILLDNGRSELLDSRKRDILRCIRCGACMNHCPVYTAVGGHSYGTTYMGPMGAVLSPQFEGLGTAKSLPFASSFCGRCEAVCPMRIPLPDLMREWREDAFRTRMTRRRERWALRGWGWVARRPRLYRVAADLSVRILSRLGRGRGALGYLPFGGGWTRARDFPAPEATSFMAAWRAQQDRQQKGRGDV